MIFLEFDASIFFGSSLLFGTFGHFLYYGTFWHFGTLIKKGPKTPSFWKFRAKINPLSLIPRYLDLSVMRITSARDLSLLQRDYRFNVKLALIAASGVHTVSPAGGPRPYS